MHININPVNIIFHSAKCCYVLCVEVARAYHRLRDLKLDASLFYNTNSHCTYLTMYLIIPS